MRSVNPNLASFLWHKHLWVILTLWVAWINLCIHTDKGKKPKGVQKAEKMQESKVCYSPMWYTRVFIKEHGVSFFSEITSHFHVHVKSWQTFVLNISQYFCHTLYSNLFLFWKKSTVNMNYIPTEEERKVLRECNEESFWYRCKWKVLLFFSFQLSCLALTAFCQPVNGQYLKEVVQFTAGATSSWLS